MNRSQTQASFLAVLIFLFAPSVLFGQAEKGAIVGAVADSQGAVIPGATVSITNIGTNASRTYTTNAEGLYETPFLTPGIYKVSGRLFVINPAAISLDYAPGTFGNIGRNAFRMPYSRHLELAAAKKIRLVR